MKRSFLFTLLFLAVLANAQNISRPKLVVGLVVDQMRWDYLYRFYDRYNGGGFKRLMNDGFNCNNAFIQYTPAHTAAGHTCIYTGSVPALNGIIGNSWYDRETKKIVYCTDDSSVVAVGSNSAAGKMSPRHIWSTTIGDELRMSTNFNSKTISISLKDRGAILPGGHTANAAYWFDNASGGFISSTYYMQNLPPWMVAFNAKKLPDAYLSQNWNTLYPISTYTQSTADDKAYENKIDGEDNTFPHRTDSIATGRYEVFRNIPASSTYTFDAAKAAIENEKLGGRGVTDLLAISLSSPDYVGHDFGPNSIEVEDTYLRLDKDIAQFLTYLDRTIGKNQYLVFLTADHGVSHASGFLKENKIPSGTSGMAAMEKAVKQALQTEFGEGNFILTYNNFQVYLNNDFIRLNKINRDAVKRTIINTILQQKNIANVVDLENIASASLPKQVQTAFLHGYNQRMSGDIQYSFKPQFGVYEKGASHALWNPYDTHIPLIWFGWNTKSGATTREVYMTDIAPTLAALLHIQTPSASIGKVITEVGKK